MATVEINKTVEVCDLCGREAYLQTCLCCQRRFCLTCDCTIYGCIVGPTVCKSCGKTDAVRAVCARYAEELVPILKRRNVDLKKLKVTAPDAAGETLVEQRDQGSRRARGGG